MQVLGATDSLPAHSAQAQPASCQVLKLVLGPLHLDLLGQLLCGLAGGTGVNSLSGLQSLLSLLNQLGISNLSAGLTELDLNRILAGLGLGSTTPSGSAASRSRRRRSRTCSST